MGDLETRVSLVEQNYRHLDDRLTKVEDKLDDIKNDMTNGQQQLIKVIIGTTGTIIAGLLSTIVIILMNMN
jgi:tetrahydromethanopterin S-methyltransferase subunit G